jgi:2-polyprenyl-3-methyl-5-hydroxy-6-metoxy-1,4-benzoquinol methylase
MFDAKGDTKFDSIVFSEVLEHMEKPGEALQLLSGLLTPEGQVFINMPINSAAPDHLFNTDTPEELFDFIGSNGLKIVQSAIYPATGNSLERSRRKRLTINCVAVCKSAASE